MFSFGFSKDSFRLSSTYEVLPSALETIVIIICIFCRHSIRRFCQLCCVCIRPAAAWRRPPVLCVHCFHRRQLPPTPNPQKHLHSSRNPKCEKRNPDPAAAEHGEKSCKRNYLQQEYQTLTIDTQAKEGFSFGNGGLMLVSGGATSVEIIRSRHLTLYYSPSLESSKSWVDKSFQISLCKIQIGRSLELHLDGKRWKFSNDPKNQN